MGEGSGTPLQYSCLENPVDGGAWWAAVHGVAGSRTRLRDFTFTFHFHALEKEMATHSSVLAWRIPGTGEPGGLPSMGSQSRTQLKQLSSSSSGPFGKEPCFFSRAESTVPISETGFPGDGCCRSMALARVSYFYFTTVSIYVFLGPHSLHLCVSQCSLGLVVPVLPAGKALHLQTFPSC